MSNIEELVDIYFDVDIITELLKSKFYYTSKSKDKLVYLYTMSPYEHFNYKHNSIITEQFNDFLINILSIGIENCRTDKINNIINE